MVAVAVVRIATGNLIGALFALVLAVVFGSIGSDYPLLSRLAQCVRLVRRLWRKILLGKKEP